MILNFEYIIEIILRHDLKVNMYHFKIYVKQAKYNIVNIKIGVLYLNLSQICNVTRIWCTTTGNLFRSSKPNTPNDTIELLLLWTIYELERGLMWSLCGTDHVISSWTSFPCQNQWHQMSQMLHLWNQLMEQIITRWGHSHVAHIPSANEKQEQLFSPGERVG